METKQSEKKNTEAKRKLRKRKTKRKEKYGSEMKRKEILKEAKGSIKIDAKFSLKHAKRKRNESRFASFRFEAKNI
jgi:hypothetical protein